MKIREKSVIDDLKDRAKMLARAGFSPIPVHGDNSPTEPKRPAVRWRQFQSRIATDAEVERDFNENVTALGIVCGRVSKLMVVDFDDLLRYQRFCRHLPQYSETYTVQTRRGFHLYFRTSVKVPTHQFDGGDIKAERSYIIAPPSRIGNFVYRCVKNVSERDLDKADVDQLLNYFHVNSSVHVVTGKRTRERRDVNLKRVYRRLALRMGRNNALYRVGSIAREQGVSEMDAKRELLRLHAKAAGHVGHKVEGLEERWQEGVRTIESAFSSGGSGGGAQSGIPNSVREQLLKAQRSTIVPRLLDIFALEGWEAEAYFRLSEAVRLGERYGLNRKSVLLALTGEQSSFDGRHIISRRYVEYLDIGGLNGRKRGRPVELAFQVPSVTRLLNVLNVGRSPSDRMRKEDVESAKSYRMAVHREYISRLRPRASLTVLARRVGVNERTIRRYNAALEVKLTACVGRLRLTREALASLPKRGWRTRKNTTSGFWLEAGDGARLPGWRHIGARLLNAGERSAWICLRLASVFSLGAEPRPETQFESLSIRQLARGLLLRAEASGADGAVERVMRAVDRLRARASAMRYERIQLFFDSVDRRIAEDKVAESISGYLFARDAGGAEVRRPARRGVAYRMLKEYGNGNVYLALRSTYKEVMLSLARDAVQVGEAERGLNLVARTLA